MSPKHTEWKVNQEAELDFEKLYGESSDENIFI